jgi:hypothetical protein
VAGSVEGNVPLAAACLKLYAQRQGLDEAFAIDLLPPERANPLGDEGLVEEILLRQPWMVGFSCYLWNIERTLWIAARLKQRRPELKVLLGGPEITADNAWVLEQPAVDYAALGEGEQTFVELLTALSHERPLPAPIPGLRHVGVTPSLRRPRVNLDDVSSPYVEGIVALSDDRRMLLETARGCRFRCKYCFYPKYDDTQRFLSASQLQASLSYATEHGASEVVLLDPTLNQRPDFSGFLRLLAQGNPQHSFTYSGELRAEGINLGTARLLRRANFHEVEIGLQSVEPEAWELMGRRVDLPAFERGVKAILGEGIKVCVDLILGLPGDTVDSVRRAIDYLHGTRAFSQVQVFNLSILPGTAFREEAAALGLTFQPRPPYYALSTPTLNTERIYLLMQEVQDAFAVEFDALPPLRLESWEHVAGSERPCRVGRIDLDRGSDLLPPAADRTQAFTLWLRAADFHACRRQAVKLIRQVLADNPFTTLQVIVEPTAALERLTAESLQMLLAACYEEPTYLDRYYSLHPGRLLGSKQIAVLLPFGQRAILGQSWRRQMANWATLLWRGQPMHPVALEEFESLVPEEPPKTAPA